MQKERPTPEYLRECFNYDPEVGELTWKVRPREHFSTDRAWKAFNSQFSEAIAGTQHIRGYIQINISGKLYKAHCLVWTYVTGRWPTQKLDHRNRVKNDNSWGNLRLGNTSQNGANRGATKNNQLGVKGIRWEEDRQRFLTRIMKDGKTYNLGRYRTLDEAKAKLDAKAIELYGEFAYVA